MFIELRDKRVDWLVNLIIPSINLYRLDPILAGGSMLSVYRAVRLFDSEDKWAEFKNSVERSVRLPSHGGFCKKMDLFGDIDIWLGEKSESKVWTSNITNDVDTASFSPMMKEMGLTSLKKSSKWANTFSSQDGKWPIQFIRSDKTCVKDILSDFDFINCSVAYHNGVMYVDARLDEAFLNLSLSINNPSQLWCENTSMRIFSALRAFKYSKRYGLDFSEDLSYAIFKIYYDTKSLSHKNEPMMYGLNPAPYGSVQVQKNTMKDMLYSLRSYFLDFSKMNSYRKEYALYLLDEKDKFPGIEKIVYNKEGSAFIGKNWSSGIALPF